MHIKHTSLALLALLATPALAQSADNIQLRWEQLPHTQQELLIQPTRERWDQATPEQRQRMLARAQRWQAMTQEERARAHRGRERFEQLSPEEQQQMRALYQSTRHLTPTDRRHAIALYHAMRRMSPEARTALRQRWSQMSATEREAWVETHAPKRQHRPDRKHGH
ncbi:hypothetical protein CO611_02485 [Lysobacteraceae bacterium NML03-0222]|nr:hypothetical protein CO611_02485 [Xanthomonadaceae bacterium NML03-0222]